MISLLLAAVLVTSVAQLLFCFVILSGHWYSYTVRVLVVALCCISTFGAFWFIGGQLVGLDSTLSQAVLYAVPQAIALCLIVLSRMYDEFLEDSPTLQTVAKRLGNMEISDEDRFVEKEVEQGEVRRRLQEADLVRKSELDAAADKLHEELEEIKRLLQGGC